MKTISCISYLEPLDRFVLSSIFNQIDTVYRPEPQSSLLWRAYSHAAQLWMLRKESQHKPEPKVAFFEERALLENQQKIGLLLTCDAPILKKSFVESLQVPIVNLHFGLSQYYRGMDTVFWPLLEGHSDRIGLTFHYIDPGIDTGPVICQYQPSLTSGETEMSVWLKLAKAANELWPQVIERVSIEKVKGKEIEKGRLCLKKDRNLSVEAKLRFREGLRILKITPQQSSTQWFD